MKLNECHFHEASGGGNDERRRRRTTERESLTAYLTGIQIKYTINAKKESTFCTYAIFPCINLHARIRSTGQKRIFKWHERNVFLFAIQSTAVKLMQS